MSRSTSIEAPPLIERIRSKHEEIEKLEKLVMKALESEHLSRREQLLQGHCLRSMTKSIIVKTEELVETYAAFTDEMEMLSDQTETWTNVSSDFPYRLEQIHEYYGKHPSRRLFNADEGYEALLNEKPVIEFREEEGFGRYLDLHDMYNQYINSNFGERVEYSAYLDVFSQPEKIPRKLKLSRQYTEYMEALLEYLIFFFQRTEPLQDLDRILYKVEQYAGGKVKGWRNHGHENELIPFHRTVGDLIAVEELVDMGPEKLIEAMRALGLNTTGGTLHQHEEILFLTVSLMEANVKKLCNLLDETIERTKQKEGEKKQALAYEENPLKQEAIMGWDGKPIPYWLCKLGLGQEYKCEICNNYSYAGKRAFERHFKESRHQRSLHWQFEGIKDEEAPAGVAIPPPNIRRRVERIALIVSRRGLEHERRIIEIYGEDDEELDFLKSADDPYHAFYQHKLTEYRARKNQDIRTDYCGEEDDVVTQIRLVPALRQEAHKFTIRVLEGMMITQKDVEIMKLTAEFWVRYGGRCYFEGLSSDHHRELEFMNNPSDGRFRIFRQIVSVYREVIHSRPKIVKEKLRKNAADIETVLENCYQRLQSDRFYKEQKPVVENRYHQRLESSRFYKEKIWKRKAKEEERATPPQLEAAKRQKKIDESELVPGEEFLAQHPGMAAIDVHILKPMDAHFEIFLPSLSETVASLKERMTSLFSVPASKQEFTGKTGLLKDNMSLAHYNVGPRETLILSFLGFP